MYRRQVVESVNAALKGAFAISPEGSSGCSAGRRSPCCLGFTIAAYNLDRVRSFRAKKAEEEAKPRRRAKRRQGTWAHCISTDADRRADERRGTTGLVVRARPARSGRVGRDFGASGRTRTIGPNEKPPARRPAVCRFRGVADESRTHRHLQQRVS